MAQTQTPTPTTLLSQIHAQRETQPLSILTLAEPLTSQSQPNPSRTPTIDIKPQSQSQQPETTPTPTSLALDLSHYRSLFSKLRFSYLEQVTKEKYLRTILDNENALSSVTAEQNASHEERLVTMKAELKAKKEENERLIGELEEISMRLAKEYELVQAGVDTLEHLPGEVDELEVEVERARQELGDKEQEMNAAGIEGDKEMDVDVNDVDMMAMDEKQLLSAVEQKQEELRQLELEISRARILLTEREAEADRLTGETEELEQRRNNVTAGLRASKKGVGKKGRQKERDVMADQGKYWRDREVVLKGLLGAE